MKKHLIDTKSNIGIMKNNAYGAICIVFHNQNSFSIQGLYRQILSHRQIRRSTLYQFLFFSPKRQQTDNTVRQYKGGTIQKRGIKTTRIMSRKAF